MVPVRRMILFSVFGVLAGWAVVWGSYQFVGTAVEHLPGGSIVAGAWLGWMVSRKKGSSRWWFLWIGALAGLTGWAIALGV